MAQTTPRASGLEPPDAEIFLADIAKECHARGWALGTSGNFSAVVRREPFVLAITGTGLHKGTLSPDNFVRVDANGSVVEGTGSPSAETALHLLLANVIRIAKTLECSPAEIVFISDVVSELDGAQAAGFQALLCKRPGNHPQPENAHSVIRTLSELFP